MLEKAENQVNSVHKINNQVNTVMNILNSAARDNAGARKFFQEVTIKVLEK